jgi:hypothetical protein
MNPLRLIARLARAFRFYRRLGYTWRLSWAKSNY